jgi:hypothetical protein
MLSSSSPLGSGTGAAFFWPLAAFAGFAGFAAGAAGASSSEKKSSAVLRADFLVGFSAASAGAALAALGDLAGFAGAAPSSDCLGFFALGAASVAPANY